MMAYATRNQLILRIGEQELIQLTDREQLANAIVDEVLDEHQAAACGEIDGYLTDGGYTLPLASVPERLVSGEVALTRWYLYTGARPEIVERDATEARKWLQRLADGSATLYRPDTREGYGEVQITEGRNVFSGGGY